MKVLLPIIWHELTHCIARAFEERGHEVRVVDWRRHAKAHGTLKVEPLCIREAMDFRPDVAFCQFQHEGLITDALPRALTSIGCFSINWSGDVRHPLPDWYKQLAPHFSVTSFTNVPDVQEILALGYNAKFLQIGYDERIYYPPPPGTERSGVVFIGNNYGGYKYAESQSRREMVAALSETFRERFRVYGMSWQGIARPESIGGYIAEPGDATILRSAAVAVGWDHFHRPGFASDRLTRATACGCAVVNQYYEGITEEHPWVVPVDTVDAMVEAVGRMLEAPHGGPENARNTLAQHTWTDRVKQIEQWWTTARTESKSTS